MSNRTRYVFGSLVGALVIHLAFIACSGSETRRFAPDALSDVLDAVRDVEVRDAHAGGDAGTCNCVEPYESTFALDTFDRGRGPEMVREDYSTSVLSALPTLNAGPAVAVVAGVSFLLPDDTRVSLNCSTTVRADRSRVPVASDGCGVQLAEPDAGTTSAGGSPSAVEVLRLTDTEVELRFPSLALRTPASAAASRTVTVTNFVVRARAPSAHFLTPPRAFRR